MDSIITNSQKRYSIIDRIYAFLYAIILLVQPIRSFLPITLSMAIIVASIPYMLFLLSRGRFKISNIFFVALYAFYRIINHGTSVEEFITMIFLILLVLVLNNDAFDFEYFFKWTLRISRLAAACVILQVVVHFILNVHIPFLNVGMLRGDLSYYESLVSTGLASNVYRPSAFFMEPSAFTQYAYPVLFYLLFKDEYNEGKKTALFISLGIIVCTSGMGIGLTVMMWGLYLFYNSFRAAKINKKWFGLFCTVIIVCLIAYMVSPQLQYSIQRIFTGIGSSNSAIQGRLGGGQYYISLLNREQLIFGAGDLGEEITMYMSGIYQLIYIDGVIAVVMFFLMFISQAIKNKGFNRILPFIVVVLTIFSNMALIHNLAYIMIFVYCLGTNINSSRLIKKRIKVKFFPSHKETDIGDIKEQYIYR